MKSDAAIGVCYYPEHWPETMWADDARRMRGIGITRVRIGEFAWSRLEPEPGRYDFDWLARAVDALHAEGLGVILGTPTATPPKWLLIITDACGALDRADIIVFRISGTGVNARGLLRLWQNGSESIPVLSGGKRIMNMAATIRCGLIQRAPRLGLDIGWRIGMALSGRSMRLGAMSFGVWSIGILMKLICRAGR